MPILTVGFQKQYVHVMKVVGITNPSPKETRPSSGSGIANPDQPP